MLLYLNEHLKSKFTNLFIYLNSIFVLFSNRILNLGDADEEQVNELKEQLNQKLDVYDKILSNQPYLAGQVNKSFFFFLFVKILY